MSNTNEKISFVFPVFNEEKNLETLYEKVKEVCNELEVDYEMIFVDDGSSDNSLDVMKKLGEQDGKVGYISLSRNFGHQSALFAGMSYAVGDAVITMDADLQHPPFLIKKMISSWQEGAEVVYTVKEKANLSFLRQITMKVFYWVFSKISKLKLNFGQSDFRLLDKKVLKAIIKIPEYHKFLRGQVEWVGFKQKGISYNVEERHVGKSTYSYRDRILLILDGIFAFSRYPLHLLMMLGMFISVMSMLYISIELLFWILINLNILDIPTPPGYVTLVVAVFFLGSVQLIAIGILGEYIGRTYDQTKGRPVFIIKESSIDKEK